MFPELPKTQSSGAESWGGSSKALLGSIPRVSWGWGVCRCPAAKGSGAAPP